MYKLQYKPDSNVTLENGSEVMPVATLKDEHGGVSHIIEDDHCYVLINGSADGGFKMAKHWYPEAVEALKTVPILKMPGGLREIEYIVVYGSRIGTNVWKGAISISASSVREVLDIAEPKIQEMGGQVFSVKPYEPSPNKASR